MMKFKTHNDKKIDTNGGYYLDYFNVPYDVLVKLFGKPHGSDEYKADAQWDIELEDGRVGSIYNYKTGKNYLGNKGLKTEDITYWHIGGKEKLVAKEIIKIIDNVLSKED